MTGLRKYVSALLIAAAACLIGFQANAADKIRFGKSVGNPLAFTPVDIGIETGIWKKHGLEVEVLVFAGDAKLQQALIADAIDFGLGSGPAMGFFAKGVPAKAVGVVANEPLSMGLIVGRPTKLKKAEDLKGAKIGVTTAGSLTYWLAREMSRQMGWGPTGIKTVPLGGMAAQLSALKQGQIDGFVMSASVGYKLDKAGKGGVLLEFGDYIKDFHTHILIATDKMIKNHPDQVRRVVAAWQEIIAYMLANKADTVRMARKVTGLDEKLQQREYDKVMPMMSRDMKFNDKALAVIGDSFTELKILPKKPDMTTLYTEEFLTPAKK